MEFLVLFKSLKVDTLLRYTAYSVFSNLLLLLLILECSPLIPLKKGDFQELSSPFFKGATNSLKTRCSG